MSVLQNSAGEEGGPEGLQNLLNEEEEDEEEKEEGDEEEEKMEGKGRYVEKMQDSLVVEDSMMAKFPSVLCRLQSLWQDLLKKVQPVSTQVGGLWSQLSLQNTAREMPGQYRRDHP